jgi:error-prone DNA polymerase
MIKGLPQSVAQTIVECRQANRFRSISDLTRRAHIGRAILARLAAADAFGSLGLNRREALWRALAAGEEMPLFAEIESEEEALPWFAEMPLHEHVVADYDTVGLSLKAHPISLVRGELKARGVLPNSELANLPHRATVQIAGLVIVRQQPGTAKGTLFVTLEDDTGIVNLILWPNVKERYRRIVNGAVALVAHGRLERSNNITHVVVTKVEDLSDWLRGLASKSHDYH